MIVEILAVLHTKR